MNSRQQFLPLKVSRLTSGVWRLLSISSKHLHPPCCVGITQPAQGASSRQAICSAGMTDQTCIIMNINLRRQNSCQLHGVRTGKRNAARSFFSASAWVTFGVFVRHARRFFFFLHSGRLQCFYRCLVRQHSRCVDATSDEISQEADKMQRWTTVTCFGCFQIYRLPKGRGQWKHTFLTQTRPNHQK